MYDHLINFIDDNNKLAQTSVLLWKEKTRQHSCRIALVDTILIGCFIDLKKAFDTVNLFV